MDYENSAPGLGYLFSLQNDVDNNEDLMQHAPSERGSWQSPSHEINKVSN